MPSNYAAIGALVLLNGLSGCTHTYDCYEPQVELAFVGLVPAETETLILRRFATGKGFAKLLDTLVITPTNNAGYWMAHDTTNVILGYKDVIKPGYDWQIVVPALHKTVHLTNIRSEQHTGEEAWTWLISESNRCTSPIFSLEQDGRLLDFRTHPPRFLRYTVFIRR